MLVRDRMTPDPITITCEIPASDALELMRMKKIRRLPVLNKTGGLIGIVSEKDLLYASPSPVTSLTVWEIRELMHMLTVKKVMTQKLVTIPEDATLEEAAVLMISNKIGGLPVLQGNRLTGIITETDLFKVFLNLLGGRRPGVRITVLIPNVKGTIAQISKAIFNAGGNIVGLGTIEFPKTDNEAWECVFKVQGVSRVQLMDTVRPVVHEITDIRSQ